MPLYELVAICSHYDKYKPIRDLVRSTALHILEHGGQVRSIKSWGTLPLPEKMRRHKVTHSYGDYYVVQFDCSPLTLKALDKAYQADPRVVRWTNIKLGGSLKEIVKPPHRTTNWGSNELAPKYPHPSLLDQLPRTAFSSVGAASALAGASSRGGGGGGGAAGGDMFASSLGGAPRGPLGGSA